MDMSKRIRDLKRAGLDENIIGAILDVNVSDLHDNLLDPLVVPPSTIPIIRATAPDLSNLPAAGDPEVNTAGLSWPGYTNVHFPIGLYAAAISCEAAAWVGDYDYDKVVLTTSWGSYELQTGLNGAWLANYIDTASVPLWSDTAPGPWLAGYVPNDIDYNELSLAVTVIGVVEETPADSVDHVAWPPHHLDQVGIRNLRIAVSSIAP